MSTPPKPESKLRKSARALEMGIALGVAAFILSALVTGEIASAILPMENPSLLFWPLLKQEIVAPLIVSPLLCYLVGLLVDGPRWGIAVSAVVTVQAAIFGVLAVSVGVSEVVTVTEIAVLLLAGAAGAGLSGFAMGRAQRRKPEPAPVSLASIDFEKVKQQVSAGAAPAADAAPAASEAASATPAPAPGLTQSTSSTQSTAPAEPAAAAPPPASETKS